MPQALWLLQGSLPSQQSPRLQSRSSMAWDSLCCTATGKTRCWCSAEVCGLQGDAQPQRFPPWGYGTNQEAVGRGSTTPEQRLGHWNRESKCL